MKSKAILFGINYVNSPSSQLRGCVNDVNNMGDFLKKKCGYDSVSIFTDEKDETKTRAFAIMNSIYALALDSHRFKLKRAWIHFSGHGCSIKDVDGDEVDGKDECIVPSDYEKVGVIPDDALKSALRSFHKNTKVTCVFDCCHSGSICDLTYTYNPQDRTCEKSTTNSVLACKAQIILLSGCMDAQTSADAYNVRGKREYSGAMTSCLLSVLEKEKKVLSVIDCLNTLLKEKQFEQKPELTSSFQVEKDYELF